MSVALQGSLWRPGLPPGVYAQQPAVAARPLVRLDVAALIGLAERGPVNTPVAIDDVRLSGIPAPTPLEAWRQTWFGTTSPTGHAANDADPDRIRSGRDRRLLSEGWVTLTPLKFDFTDHETIDLLEPMLS